MIITCDHHLVRDGLGGLDGLGLQILEVEKLNQMAEENLEQGMFAGLKTFCSSDSHVSLQVLILQLQEDM